MRELAARVVESRAFQHGIIALIVLNGVVIGAATSDTLVRHAGAWLDRIDDVILWIFVAEAALKLTAVWPNPGRYFRDPWNDFDFTVVALSLVPATGQFATVARLLRLLRVMRLVSAIPELRLIVSTLLRSLPSMGHVVLLMSIVFYIYGVVGFHLFHEHDPRHWGNLGLSFLTLFRVVTLEDWTDVMYTAMELHPLAWIYFVSFVVVGTFVVINLFIAVVINNLETSKQKQRQQQPVSREDLQNELQELRASLARLETRLRNTRWEGGPARGAG